MNVVDALVVQLARSSRNATVPEIAMLMAQRAKTLLIAAVDARRGNL